MSCSQSAGWISLFVHMLQWDTLIQYCFKCSMVCYSQLHMGEISGGFLVVLEQYSSFENKKHVIWFVTVC